MSCCNGILLVDKPAGMTSFAVVSRVRRALLAANPHLVAPSRRARYLKGDRRRFRCGHAGSLDPLATGLLVLMCGVGTRLAPVLFSLDKAYEALIRFGAATDTLDADGRITERLPVRCEPEDLMGQLPSFRGAIAQVPPAFSAIKRNGKRLYELARKGVEIPDVPPKSVVIHKLDLSRRRWGDPAAAGDEAAAADGCLYEAMLLVECSSGTYVRSLARDLAASVATCGHVRALRRLRVGPFSLNQALAPELLDDGAALTEAIQPLGRAVPHLPIVRVSASEAGHLRAGGQPLPNWLERLTGPVTVGAKGTAYYQMQDQAGSLVAIGRLTGKGGLPRSAAVFQAEAREGEDCV